MNESGDAVRLMLAELERLKGVFGEHAEYGGDWCSDAARGEAESIARVIALATGATSPLGNPTPPESP